MTEPIVSRASVEAKARAAAKTYDNVNDACPYPFATQAGQLFSAEFKRERAAMDAKLNGATATAPTTNKQKQKAIE